MRLVLLPLYHFCSYFVQNTPYFVQNTPYLVHNHPNFGIKCPKTIDKMHRMVYNGDITIKSSKGNKMNNTIQGKIFLRALNKADKGDVDMPAADWAQATGLMRNYGHGYEWEDFTEAEAVKAIERIAEEYSEEAVA